MGLANVVCDDHFMACEGPYLLFLECVGLYKLSLSSTLLGQQNIQIDS